MKDFESVAISSMFYFEVRQLTEWIAEQILPFLKGKILEIGSGNGQLAEYLIKKGILLRLSDPHGQYCHLLLNKFEQERAIKGVHRIKLENVNFELKYADLLQRFDTVIMINYVQTDPGKQWEYNNAKKLLREDGNLIVVLPAKTAPFGPNQTLNEWKSYNQKDSKHLLGNEMEYMKSCYFNLIRSTRYELTPFSIGTTPQKDILENQSSQDIPIFEMDDKFPSDRIGLSMIVIRKKVLPNDKYN